MSFNRDEPNPLRPYAIPPSVGRPSITGTESGPRVRANATSAATPKSNASYRRDLLSELDYGDYLQDASPSMVEMIKNLVDQGVWKYTSVFLAQPFDVAKTLLQVQDAEAVVRASKDKGKAKQQIRRQQQGRRDSFEPLSDDSDDDAQSYFTSTTPMSQSMRSRKRHSSSPSPPNSASPTTSSHTGSSAAPHKHNLPSPSSVTTAISTLWTHEGAWGIWKGTNSTFIYNVFYGTITSFLRSLLCAVLGLPDPGTSASTAAVGPFAAAAIDIATAPAPLLSLIAAVTASGLAGVLLAPLDIARTKLILTPSTHPPRSIVPTLKSLKSWIIPASIAPATILHSALPTFMTISTPLFLRSNLGVDPILTPTTYSFATFCSQVVELGLRLPIETVLRRGQAAVVMTHSVSPRQVKQALPLQTTVDLGIYKGLVGTMYHIVFEEGTQERKPTKPATEQLQPPSRRKGQGVEGLYRGWRVGFWGLIGVWSAAALGNGKGGEF